MVDSSHADAVLEFFRGVETSCTIDCAGLEYISSAGLGILVATYKRLSAKGHTMKLVNVQDNVKKILLLVQFDRIFSIE